MIYTGWPRGSEGFGENASQSWRQYVVDPKEPSRVGFFKCWLFHDPNWDFRTIDWDRDLAFAEQQLPHMAAVDTNLAGFKKRGGKLLSYTGWMDPVVPPQDTVAYYEGVTRAMGGLAATQSFYRLFMAPGMGHCAGGPGPNQFDAMTALEQWVEKGVAPATLLATHSTGGKVARSRPLCPYPQVARYTGTGSIDEAANFTCVAAPARPDFVFGKSRVEEVKAFEHGRDILQGEAARLQPRRVEKHLAVGGVAVVLNDFALGIEALVDERLELVGVVTAPRLRVARGAVIGGDHGQAASGARLLLDQRQVARHLAVELGEGVAQFR